MKYSCFHEECRAESDLGASTAPPTRSAPCQAHEGGASSQALLLITPLISSAGCLLSSCRRHAVPSGREIHHPTQHSQAVTSTRGRSCPGFGAGTSGCWCYQLCHLRCHQGVIHGLSTASLLPEQQLFHPNGKLGNPQAPAPCCPQLECVPRKQKY